jgi:hypothetical protein
VYGHAVLFEYRILPTRLDDRHLESGTRCCPCHVHERRPSAEQCGWGPILPIPKEAYLGNVHRVLDRSKIS